MTKEEVIAKIETGELEIFKKYKKLYGSELEEITHELATSYNFLGEVIKRDKEVVSDNRVLKKLPGVQLEKF